MASATLKAWISAARLRTLPLSISGIIMGYACAYYYGNYYIFLEFTGDEQLIQSEILYMRLWRIAGLALLTTLGFQVLSNFANDYGDGVKGTDNDDRIGPVRAIQSGVISASEMKRGIIITATISLISAVLLIYVSLGIQHLLISLFFLVLGIAAIWAAIKYTVGDNAYGYRGLGDVFVFIFFGPVSVMGVYYLITQELNLATIFPSLTIGLLSVAVLNLNNMRDIASDAKAGKNTIVVKLGLIKAKRLHYTFISVALFSAIIFSIINYTIEITWRFFLEEHKYIEAAQELLNATVVNFPNSLIPESFNPYLSSSLLLFLPLLAFVPLLIHLRTVYKNESPALLDPELKKVALSTFFYAILSVIAVTIVHSL